MIYLFTILLLLSLMFSSIFLIHVLVPILFICVQFLFWKQKLLNIKGLFLIHLLWIIFFAFFFFNYFNFHNEMYFQEFLLLFGLSSSMYIGIYCGVHFKQNLLYIFCILIITIFFQLIKQNSLHQIISERWTITTGWVHSNAIGAILVFILPLLYLIVLGSRNKIVKIVTGLIMLLSIGTLFLLSSRGSILAFVTVLIYIIIISKNKLRNLLFVLIGFLFLVVCYFNIDIFKQSVDLTINRFTNQGLNGRDELWNEAFNLFKSNLLFGIGARNLYLDDFHNPLLQIAAHYGLFTVIPFAFLLMSPFFLLKIKQLENKNIVLMFATYLAILVQSSIEPILTPLITGSIGWYLIGLLYGFLMKNQSLLKINQGEI